MKLYALVALTGVVTGAAIDKRSSDPKVKELWKGINVTHSNITTTVKGEPLATSDTLPPPNMPDWDKNMSLPKDFLWGWASASYQIEGAADAEGKGPSIWDKLTHTPGVVKEGTNGDITNEHYWLYQQDAQRMKAMGLPYYSMTISWPRIFPLGNGKVNKQGLQHYIDEVDYLVSLGVEPVVTLFHWDLPYALQKQYGGWANETIVDDFVEYARVVFDALGDKVNHWFTINEPQIVAMHNAGIAKLVPDSVMPMHGIPTEKVMWTVGHNLLLAHAKTVKMFREKFGDSGSKKKISYKNSFQYAPPQKSQDHDDQVASNRSMDFNCGWFAKPVHGDGDYPDTMKQTLGDLLPKFTEEQKKSISGSADFFAWDSYCGNLAKAPEGGVEACLKNTSHPSWPSCAETAYVNENGWQIGQYSSDQSTWLYSTPQLVREGTRWLWNKYKLKDIMLTELGTARQGEDKMPLQQVRYDALRSYYYVQYLNEILKLVNIDKVNVSGALGWASTDNLEWFEGLKARFGMQHVNMTTQQRTFKQSAFVFTDFFKHYVSKK